MAPPRIEPIAPLTGTVHYPLDALLALAKLIIKDVHAHHTALRDAADDVDDEDTSAEEGYNIAHIYTALIQVDPHLPPSMNDEEVTEAARRWVEDPRSAERGLLELGLVGTIGWVIDEAVARRKSMRGAPPPDDPSWSTEDALLDLIQFLSKSNHAGLFAPSA